LRVSRSAGYLYAAIDLPYMTNHEIKASVEEDFKGYHASPEEKENIQLLEEIENVQKRTL